MNIVGFWTGQYAYDAIAGLVVEFHAELGQLGDTLSGQSTEKNTFSTGAGQILIADLFGTVSRSSIDFTKQYTNAAPGQPKIVYQGKISKDGSLITGQWTMRDQSSGSFKMRRAIEQKPKAKTLTSRKIERV